MSKDQAGTELKAGDRVTISGVVAHAGESDAAPCQVLLDVTGGEIGPLVTFESRLLKTSGQPSVSPAATDQAKASADAGAAPVPAAKKN